MILYFDVGIAAICMALLVEKGHLDYEEKVAHYWPEFGQNGKENITVKTLLNHQVCGNDSSIQRHIETRSIQCLCI